MTGSPSPEAFASWAARARPGCSFCGGRGYLYWRADPPPLRIAELLTGRPPPDMAPFVGGCVCLAETERAS